MGIPHYHPGPQCFCDRPDGVAAPVRETGPDASILLTVEALEAASRRLDETHSFVTDARIGLAQARDGQLTTAELIAKLDATPVPTHEERTEEKPRD